MTHIKMILFAIYILLIIIATDMCQMAEDTMRIKKLMHLNNSILNDIYIKQLEVNNHEN